MDLKAGVECKMLSCIWSSQKYVPHHISQLRISKTMIHNTLYMQLRSHVYNLQQRHIKTDPLKCGKYGHRMLSTTHEYKEFVIQVLMTIVGILIIKTNSTVENIHMNGCHHTSGDTIYCHFQLSVHEYAYVQGGEGLHDYMS